jgi:hypothetical protein
LPYALLEGIIEEDSPASLHVKTDNGKVVIAEIQSKRLARSHMLSVFHRKEVILSIELHPTLHISRVPQLVVVVDAGKDSQFVDDLLIVVFYQSFEDIT